MSDSLLREQVNKITNLISSQWQLSLRYGQYQESIKVQYPAPTSANILLLFYSEMISQLIDIEKIYFDRLSHSLHKNTKPLLIPAFHCEDLLHFFSKMEM